MSQDFTKDTVSLLTSNHANHHSLDSTPASSPTHSPPAVLHVSTDGPSNDLELTDSSIERTERGSEPPVTPTTDANRAQTWLNNSYVILASVVAAIGGVLFGYDVGIISGAVLQLKRPDVFALSCLEQELVVSFMLLGAIIGSLTGGFFIDKYGRKVTIILVDIIFVGGAVFLALSGSIAVLLIGRLIVGFAVSVSANVECIYISEIAPVRIRGRLVSFNELGITLGFLFAYLIDYLFIEVDNGWRFMFGLSVIPAAVQCFAMIFLPKSPRYLLINNQESQAERVLQKLRRKPDITGELNAIKLSLLKEKNHGILDLFSKTDNMPGRMLIAGGLVLFQQITGQPSVLYYAPTIFGAIGFTTDTAKTLATVGLGVVKVLATISSLLLVDRFGRRRLLIIGSILMCLSLLSLGIMTSLQDKDTFTPDICEDLSELNQTSADTVIAEQSNTSALRSQSNTHNLPLHSNLHKRRALMEAGSEISDSTKYLSLMCMLLFVASYGIGYGPITWLILSEIFPAAIKGRAISLATVLNWSANLLVSLTLLSLIVSIDVNWTFILYSMISLFACIFIFTFVPETRNKSLEQISSDLRSSIVVPTVCCRTLRQRNHVELD